MKICKVLLDQPVLAEYETIKRQSSKGEEIPLMARILAAPPPDENSLVAGAIRRML